MFVVFHIICTIWQVQSKLVAPLQPHSLSQFFNEHINNSSSSNVLLTSNDIIGVHLKNLIAYKTNNMGMFLSKLDFKPLKFIISVDNINELEINLKILKESSVYSSYATLDVMIGCAHVQAVADLLWQYKMVRSRVVCMRSTEVDVRSIKLIHCNQVGTTRSQQLDLVAMFHGCPLYVITGIEPPFINQQNDSRQGIFGDVMDVFGASINRPLVRRPYNPLYTEEIVESYSFQSMVEDFQSGYAEMYIAPVPFTAIGVLDIGPPILGNDLLFLVPRKFISSPADLLLTSDNWQHFIVWSWYVVAGLVLFNIMIRYTVDRDIFGSLPKTLFLFFGIWLGMSPLQRVPRNLVVKVTLASILLLVNLFNTYIQGDLISILNGPFYEPPIKTLKELVAKDVPIKLHPTMAFFFQYTQSDFYEEIHKRNSLLDIYDMFEAGMLSIEEGFATVVYDGFQIMQPNIHEAFSVIKFFSTIHTVAMPKDFYLHQEFCQWLSRMVEHGIVTKYVNSYKFSYALENLIDTETRGYSVTMKQIEPALLVLIIGCVMAMVVFSLEMVAYRLQIFFSLRH